MFAHWREYAGEALGLGLFMIAACSFGAALGHPDSPLVRALPDPFVRRALAGAAMGLTAILLIRSPWGQRSGAHLNPATTLTFWRLGTVETRDAIGYAIAQIAGGLAGVAAAAAVLGALVGHPDVNYVATTPGRAGIAAAFAAEALIAFVLMSVVLRASNTAGLARHTPLFVGALVAIYITVEAPISGMSRLRAAERHGRRPAAAPVYCAKLDHDNPRPCIFRCRYAELLAPDRSAASDVGPRPLRAPAPIATASAPEDPRTHFTGARMP
jgi:aquaporin Z